MHQILNSPSAYKRSATGNAKIWKMLLMSSVPTVFYSHAKFKVLHKSLKQLCTFSSVFLHTFCFVACFALSSAFFCRHFVCKFFMQNFCVSTFVYFRFFNSATALIGVKPNALSWWGVINWDSWEVRKNTGKKSLLFKNFWKNSTYFLLWVL